MPDTVRFGVSLSLQLLDDFDALIRRKGYDNRSEAVRDLIRDKLVEEQWETPEGEAFAVACLVYDHHTMSLPTRLTEMQHDSLAQVVGSFHVHIDAHNCLEIVVMHGKGGELRALGDRMKSLKGVKFGRLVLGTSGSDLA